MVEKQEVTFIVMLHVLPVISIRGEVSCNLPWLGFPILQIFVSQVCHLRHVL